MGSRQPPQNDPLEAAREALARLKDADDWDEPTGRTEVTVHLQHAPAPPPPPQREPVASDGELSVERLGVKAKGIPPRALGFAIGVLALAAAVVAILKALG